MQQLIKRYLSLFFGTVLFALGIVVTMKANLGFAPWDVLHRGIGQAIGLTIGKVSILTSLVICILVLILGEKLGLGTLVNMLVIGTFIDIFLGINMIPQMQGILSGIVMLLLGLFTISFGTYFYIRSGFGAGPRDSLMVAIRRITKLPIGLCRGLLELSIVLIGWRLGGPVGIGTAIAAFSISFCIQIVFAGLKFDATKVKHETLDVTFKNFKAALQKSE
jgi:uncharacterized membrane protein YczE